MKCLNEKPHLEEFAVEFSIKATSPEKLKSDCVAVPVFASGKLSPAAQQLDRAAKGQLSRILKQGDFDPNALRRAGDCSCPRVAGRLRQAGGGGCERVSRRRARRGARARRCGRWR